jgi:hypothetical protein
LSQGILVLAAIPDTANDWESLYREHDRGSDALSVAWLDDAVVAAGYRNGIVGLFDTRTRGQVARLQHPGPVVHMHAVDATRVVAAGVQHCVSFFSCWRMGP